MWPQGINKADLGADAGLQALEVDADHVVVVLRTGKARWRIGVDKDERRGSLGRRAPAPDMRRDTVTTLHAHQDSGLVSCAHAFQAALQ